MEEILNGGRGWASNGGYLGGRAHVATLWLVDGQRGRGREMILIV
jgi:hypothetical protein